MTDPVARAGPGRPTARQVAVHAGVSPATVSNVLHGTGRVSEATRRRVLAAADELSFRPYAAALAPARGGTGMLGLTLATYGDLDVPYVEIAYYRELVLAATGTAHRLGYLLVVLPESLPPSAWLSLPLDGVVHVEPRRDDPVLAALRRRGIAAVTLGRPLEPRAPEPWVDTDTGLATRELLDHLWERGRRRVALVVPDHDDAYPADVEAAYLAWCAERQAAPCTARFEVGEYDEAERRVARELLVGEPRPDAVVGLYDASGVHLLEAARDLGLRVPDDVAVASFGEDEGQAHADPPLTTVSLRPQAVAREAVELLLDLLHGRRTAGRTRLVPGELIVRSSTSARPRAR